MYIPNTIPPVSPCIVRSNERTPHEIPKDDKNFDKITLQHAKLSPEQSFTMETIGRVTQEVRAATTTGDIQSLREKVAAGQYQINVDNIARRILLK